MIITINLLLKYFKMNMNRSECRTSAMNIALFKADYSSKKVINQNLINYSDWAKRFCPDKGKNDIL